MAEETSKLWVWLPGNAHPREVKHETNKMRIFILSLLFTMFLFKLLFGIKAILALKQLYIATGLLQTSVKILLRAGVHVQGNAYRASLHHTPTERVRAYTHTICMWAELDVNQLNHPHNKTCWFHYQIPCDSYRISQKPIPLKMYTDLCSLYRDIKFTHTRTHTRICARTHTHKQTQK